MFARVQWTFFLNENLGNGIGKVGFEPASFDPAHVQGREED